jgi:hypothetical protein
MYVVVRIYVVNVAIPDVLHEVDRIQGRRKGKGKGR